jgi:DNA-binding HxlR family transcriptional regulator
MIDQPCVPFVADCHVRAAADLISHAWDPVVLSALRAGPMRRRELLARIGGLSDKVLTESLRRLQSTGLVAKTSENDQAGAHYELTALGTSFAEGPLLHLAHWAAEHQADLAMGTEAAA